jgi:uncharacterized tellurite resistance protein B-like protein
MKAHIDTITDLLLGAAYADKRLEGGELKSISAMLCKLLGTDELPAAQHERITGFNPAKFDVKAAAGRLRFESAENKRKVLELVASVSESDDEIDMAEDAYLRKVAAGLGMSDADIKDLTIEVLEDDELEGILG